MGILSEQQRIALDKFAKQATIDMKLAVRTKKISNGRQSAVNASGSLDESIGYKLLPDGVEIYGNDYVYYLVYGRRGGNAPPFQSIREWIDDKGIVPDRGSTDEDKDGMAWAIVKTIAKEGTSIYKTFNGQDSGLFADIFDEESLAELGEQLMAAVSLEFESMIFNEFNNIAI